MAPPRVHEPSPPDGEPTPARPPRRGGPPSPESRLTSKVMSLRLPPVVRAGLEDLADQWGMSRSATVAKLVAMAVGLESTAPPPPPPRPRSKTAPPPSRRRKTAA